MDATGGAPAAPASYLPFVILLIAENVPRSQMEDGRPPFSAVTGPKSGELVPARSCPAAATRPAIPRLLLRIDLQDPIMAKHRVSERLRIRMDKIESVPQ